MSCHYARTSDGSVRVVLTMKDIYSYKGFTFEFHNHLGFEPLSKKNWKPLKRVGKGFWDAAMEWFDLSDEEKEKTRVCG